MDEDTLKCFAAISEFALEVAELQAASMKVFLPWLGYLERRVQVLRESLPLPEDVAAQLAAIENELSSQLDVLRPLIQDSLARVESWHERVEHHLAHLKASLQPPPEEESP